jgi:hypothetical protein
MLLFLILLCAARLTTTIKIGADEDYELSKALLYMRDFQFYTDVWNDQPLLHTAIVSGILKHFSLSVLGPRLLTVAFSILLIASLFSLVRRISGLFVATLSSLFLIASPGFVDLSSSCMVEIPALAPAVAGLAALKAFQLSRPKLAMILAGALFGFALQIKLINLILLPLVLIMIWIGNRDRWENSVRMEVSPPGNTFNRTLFTTTIIGFLVFFGSMAVTFAAINSLLTGGSYLLQLKQTWLAHFAPPVSHENGSPNDFPFEWTVLIKNWDHTIAACFGIYFCVRNVKRVPWLMLPVFWVFLELIVFGIHKPWWSYYYVHNAVPTVWCAAMGVAFAFDRLGAIRSKLFYAGAGLFAVSAAAWMAARVYFQVATIRHSPQTYNSLVLTEIARFKPFTEFMFTDEGVYSFHAGIPLPPRLAVVSLKRYWSGDITHEKLRAELWKVKPGLILLKSMEVPFQDLLRSEYSLVYDDQKHQLYARKDVVKQAKW